jgi:hypothetical protein
MDRSKPGYTFITVQIKGVPSFYVELNISPELIPQLKNYLKSAGVKPSVAAIAAFSDAIMEVVETSQRTP